MQLLVRKSGAHRRCPKRCRTNATAPARSAQPPSGVRQHARRVQATAVPRLAAINGFILGQDVLGDPDPGSRAKGYVTYEALADSANGGGDSQSLASAMVLLAAAELPPGPVSDPLAALWCEGYQAVVAAVRRPVRWSSSPRQRSVSSPPTG